MDVKKLTIEGARGLVEKGEASYEDIHKEYVSLIEQNKDLNAFLNVLKDGSGVSCAVKDNILIKDEISTAGSKILENYKSAYDATVIKRLREKEVSFVGKTNLDEFAMGASTENSAFGPTKNPHDPTKVPGGSSGGSAAAVAAGLCTFALGSDTGGSIRQPAAFCGVVGLKPTYGRVSRYGLIALGSSLDQIGPITKNVYDTAYVMNIIAGKDKMDSTTVDVEVPDYTQNLDEGIKGMKIGIPKEYFGEGLDEKVKKTVEDAVKDLEKAGAEIVEASLPHSKYAVPAYYIILPSEISANLSRFDGIRYGHSNQKGDNLTDVYLNSREEGFGDEPKRRIMLGTYSLSSGYFDAYYMKAQQVRALIKQDFDKAFEKVDVLVGPTTPTTAFDLGEKTDDPVEMYLADIYTAAINLAGLPAISIPCGKVDNLPVGLQIIGKQFDEPTVLKAAYTYEQMKSW
jgi:aspartyl-tRNA(Asn)/glutamyl-tRNA(Gln) amidotransferase subunit A